MAVTNALLVVRGRLGSAPEARETKSGKTVVSFDLAVDQGFGESERTEWVRVSIWNESQGRAAVRYLDKGDLISCQTESFRINAWVSRDGSARGQLEISPRRVDYLITKRSATDDGAAEQDNEPIPF